MSLDVGHSPLPGSRNLPQLLRTMTPTLDPKRYTFCTVPDFRNDVGIQVKATFVEEQGTTLVIEYDDAEKAALSPSGEWALVTLKVHSSLEAVGFIAAIATTLAAEGISSNVMSGHFHDHVFVQWAKRDAALSALLRLAAQDPV